MDEFVCVCVCVCVCGYFRLSQNQAALIYKTGNHFIWQLSYLKVAGLFPEAMIAVSRDSRLHQRYNLHRTTSRGVKRKP
jgi:hypothetical protein